MLDQVKALLDLKKEIPDAVGYEMDGPDFYPLPSEILATLPTSTSTEIEGMIVRTLRIDNFSSKKQHNIKILFSGSWSYAPRINFMRRSSVQVKYDIFSNDKEILLHEVPPNETVFIHFFNTKERFKIDQVLIGDNAISKTMQRLANAKRSPELVKLTRFLWVFALMMAAVLLLSFYGIWKKYSDNKIIEDASAGHLSCSSYVYDNSSFDVNALKQKYQKAGQIFQSYVLSVNKVKSFDELQLKEKVILCDQN